MRSLLSFCLIDAYTLELEHLPVADALQVQHHFCLILLYFRNEKETMGQYMLIKFSIISDLIVIPAAKGRIT